MQVQVATWFMTLHLALMPQVPGQGSMHLFLWPALSEGTAPRPAHARRHGPARRPSSGHEGTGALSFEPNDAGRGCHGSRGRSPCDGRHAIFGLNRLIFDRRRSILRSETLILGPRCLIREHRHWFSGCRHSILCRRQLNRQSEIPC